MKLELTKCIVFVMVILMLSGCGDAKLPKTGKYRELLKWLQGLGGHVFGCSIRPTSGAGMGVVADRDMQEGTRVMKVPFTAMIRQEFTLVPGHFSSTLNNAVSLTLKDNAVSGALFILHEKKKGNSFWKPYLDILPDVVGNILSFSDDELKELEGSRIAHTGKEEKSQTFFEMDKLLQDVNKVFPEITREDLVWATSIWSSRAYRVPVPTDSDPSDRKQVGRLVPLADMVNTAVAIEDSNAECGYLTDEGLISYHYDFCCTLTKNVTAGEELRTMYQMDLGKLHNTYFLFHYGFVVQNNPHNCVYLKVPTVPPSTSLYSWRTTIAEELPINRDSLYCMNKTKDGNSNVSELIRLMRLLAARSHEVKKSTEAEHPFLKPLSIESEKKALGLTIYYLEDTLRGYPTTIHEDEAILEQKHLSANVRNAVLLRHGEKSVLKENIDYIHKKLGDLMFSEHPATCKSSEL